MTGQLRQMRNRSEFLAANRGLRFPMPAFVLLVRARSDGDSTRGMGFTVSKKVGNAVTRNRMKRRLRMLARTALPDRGIAGADHVLIGRHGGNELAFADIAVQLDTALARASRKLAQSA